MRRAVVGRGDPAKQIALALGRYADIDEAVMVPCDQQMADAAVAAGRTWGEVAPTSTARLAIRDLARRVAGTSTAAGGRPRRRLLQVRS